MLMPLSNTLIVVMIDRAWVSPWVWWSLGMTRRDPGSVMLTGVNIVQLDYLFHIKGLSVWSLIATQRLKEIFGKRPDMQIWIFGDFYLPLYKTIQYHARPCNTPLLDCVCYLPFIKFASKMQKLWWWSSRGRVWVHWSCLHQTNYFFAVLMQCTNLMMYCHDI